mmetsp:Transcript_63840/g.100940  ORF Transcript_63840/g.100940 Transcript_63840/m.100940 type:complete len:232 (+) Transcript_63840:112-807(+)
MHIRCGRIARRCTVLVIFACLLPSSVEGQIAWNTLGWGEIIDIPERDSEFYFNSLRSDYKFRLQSDYVQYTIDLLINPCKDSVRAGGRGENCCQSTNRNPCQDDPEVPAGPDLLVAYFQNNHVVSCRGTLFEEDPNCGTYIEVHRKFGPDRLKVLADVRIDETAFPNGYLTTRIATFQLCLGEYQLWWVVRTRSGPYVQKTKDFHVTTPTCATPVGAIPAQASTDSVTASF